MDKRFDIVQCPRTGQMVQAWQLLDLPSQRIDVVGHRTYVGGSDDETWYGIGKLQYYFLVRNGLLPSHRFLDVACGSLRLGQFLIPYLQPRNYLGLEMSAELIEAGIEHEIGADMAKLKQPRFACNPNFDVSSFPSFDFGIAQSLFTHMHRSDIERCLSAVRSIAHAGSRFYFTFFVGDSRQNPEVRSHPNLCWWYSIEEMRDVSQSTGWCFGYIGDWDHPRDQMICELSPSG